MIPPVFKEDQTRYARSGTLNTTLVHRQSVFSTVSPHLGEFARASLARVTELWGRVLFGGKSILLYSECFSTCTGSEISRRQLRVWWQRGFRTSTSTENTLSVPRWYLVVPDLGY